MQVGPGFAFAVFVGTWHALWGFLLWAGAAQWLLDFFFRPHMITPPYHVSAFNLARSTGLVLTTAGVGYVSGWFIGVVWNQFSRIVMPLLIEPVTRWA